MIFIITATELPDLLLAGCLPLGKVPYLFNSPFFHL